MELNITALAKEDAFQFSHSRHEGGQNAGSNSWRAAMDGPLILTTEEQFQEARDYFRSTGGWDAEECAAFTEQELNALLLQFISGDIREAGADSLEDIDWEEYEADENRSGRLYRSGEEYFFYLGS